MAKEAIFIIGAIAAGVAVAGSLFLLYPDVMFKGTSLDTQGGASTDVPVFVDETTTAGAGSNSTNSTAGTTGQPTTTEPPY
jgi:hypothetical protein